MLVGYPHRPYPSRWCALDDVSVENGTVYLLPYSRAGTRGVVEHVEDEETNDMVGCFGDDPGDPVVVAPRTEKWTSCPYSPNFAEYPFYALR